MTKILVVDDEEVDRELAARSLKGIKGLKILEARNGEEALKVLSRGTVDLVLTDLRMPKLDGLELVRQLEADDGSPPVVLMTSRGSERIAVRALEAGAANYVPKRSLRAELETVVTRVLEIAEARKTRRRAVEFLERREIRFSLPSSPELISPLSAWFQDGLEHLGFGTASMRAQIGIALMEAISNAMLHGNLEIGSELRREDRDAYDALIRERSVSEPWASRRVSLEARESVERVEYTVTDEGDGFDPGSLPDPTSQDAILEVAGRGVYLIRTFMDEATYNEKGNRLVMIKRTVEGSGSLSPARR